MAAAFSSAPSFLQHPLAASTTQLPAGDLPNTWILEFILRQPIPDNLISEIFLSLPFSSPEIHPHISKTLLLRRISSDLHRRSLSDRTLHSLQLIARLDRRPSHLLKAAYCAAAVECAVSALLISGGELRDAVEKIWMADAAESLVSVQFLEWGQKLGRCVSTGEGCEEILKRDVEGGMKSVGDYLDEALAEMGPPFLQIVAAELGEKRMDLDAVEELDENDGFKSVLESGFHAGIGFVLELLLLFICLMDSYVMLRCGGKFSIFSVDI